MILKIFTNKLLNGPGLQNNGDGNIMRGAGAQDGDDGGGGGMLMAFDVLI